MKITFTKAHENLLANTGKSLRELQELNYTQPMDVNEFIHTYINPIIVDGSPEESDLADDLITMIKEWKIGQTEQEYDDDWVDWE